METGQRESSSDKGSNSSSKDQIFEDALEFLFDERLPIDEATKLPQPLSETDDETHDEVDELSSEVPSAEDIIDLSQLPDHLEAESLLSKELKQARKAVDLFLNSDFQQAEQIVKAGYKQSLCLTHGHAVLTSVKSLMTFDPSDIAYAHSLLKTAIQIADHYRKHDHSTLGNLKGLVKGHPLDDMTILQRHAELIYAEAHLLKTVLSVIMDQSLMAFVKEGITIRSSYLIYRQCIHFINHNASKSEEGKEDERDEDIDADFISGVRFGIGMFNLVLSLLPTRALKIIEIIGFEGSRNEALSQLQALDMKNGLREFMCNLTIIAYHTLVSGYVASVKPDLEVAHSLIQAGLDKYPKSPFYLYFAGREQFTRHAVEKALPFYKRSIECAGSWVQLQHICYWESAICHICQLEFSNASACIYYLQKDSKWSKSAYMYMRASHLIMAKEFDNIELSSEFLESSVESEIESLIKQVPEKMQRIAGRRIPFEKFVSRKSRKYLMQNKRLHLPSFELMMIWNAFERCSPESLQKILEILNRADQQLLKLAKSDGSVKHLSNKSSWPYDNFMDDYCLNTLLSAIVYRSLGKCDGANEKFQILLKIDKHLVLDHYYAPLARYEYGRLLVSQGKYKEAKEMFHSSQKDYKKYSLENSIQMKIHNAMTDLKERQSSSQQSSTVKSSLL